MNQTFTRTSQPSKASEFASAHAALQAAAVFDASVIGTFRYEIEAVFNNDRGIDCWRARVMDLEGFGMGYVSVAVGRGVEDKARKLNEAVSAFVTELQAEGDHEGAARIAALITLPLEQQATVYDALNAGESKADFLARLSAGLNLPAKERA